MDWPLAIDINRKALLRIVAGLFVQLGLVPGNGLVETVTLQMHGIVASTLRPVEAAVRRLIVMETRGLKAPVHAARTGPVGLMTASGNRKRIPAFRLFDPRMNPEPKPKTAAGDGPRIWFLDGLDAPRKNRNAPASGDTISATRLCRRLLAVQAALDNLPAQARRLVRALARSSGKWKRVMRYARPPGHRKGGKREIDDILLNCQTFALWVTEGVDAPDTG